MNSIAPVWDGNETWLVLGGGGLMAAFPLAYAHDPVGALCADHRHAAGADLPRRRLRVPLARSRAIAAIWDVAFTRRLDRRGASRRASRWARCCRASPSRAVPMPAAGWTGCRRSACWSASSLVVGYALLGATWLIMKTEGTLQDALLSPGLRIGHRHHRRHRRGERCHAVPRATTTGSAGSPGRRSCSLPQVPVLVVVATWCFSAA